MIFVLLGYQKEYSINVDAYIYIYIYHIYIDVLFNIYINLQCVIQMWRQIFDLEFRLWYAELLPVGGLWTITHWIVPEIIPTGVKVPWNACTSSIHAYDSSIHTAP